jgi:predicted transcriptional regulator
MYIEVNMPMVRTQIYLPKETHERLRSLARVRRHAMAKIIRELVEQKIQKPVMENSTFDVLYKNAAVGPKNLAERHDQYLYS